MGLYDPVAARDVFVSHSSQDASTASEIVARLETLGVTCWIAPRDVQPGPTYADSLYYAIENAPVFVVLMSAAANASVHVARELEIASQMEKRIVPVRLEQFAATGAFCYYTRAAHFYRWDDEPDVVARIARQVASAKTQKPPRGDA
jgi:hypothetical protein